MSQPALMPAYLTVSGIGSFAVSEKNFERDRIEPKPETSWTFIDLAAAVNIGLKIIESPRGRQKLNQLGDLVVASWSQRRAGSPFRGNRRLMSTYVDHFLTRLRQDFPQVIVDDMESGPNVLANAVRIPLWNGDLANYRPKHAVSITYNYERVAAMTAASISMYDDSLSNRNSGRGGNGSSSSRSGGRGAGRGSSGGSGSTSNRNIQPKMRKRHQQFQFLFGVATAHELCHAFVAYLSHNEQGARGFTPPNISHLNYHENQPGLGMTTGESGRWFENQLFGGSIEFYRDPRDDNGQTGIPYLIDSRNVAWRIHRDILLPMIENPAALLPMDAQPTYDRYTGQLIPDPPFCLPIEGTGLDYQMRQLQGLRSLGSPDTGARLPAGPRYMQAQWDGPLLMYNLTEEQLRLAAVEARKFRAVRVR